MACADPESFARGGPILKVLEKSERVPDLYVEFGRVQGGQCVASLVWHCNSGSLQGSECVADQCFEFGRVQWDVNEAYFD